MLQQTERQIHNQLHIFRETPGTDRLMTFYHQALRKTQWVTQLDWSREIAIPKHLRNTVWDLASQSTYAEQTGMLSAALLMLEAPDLASQLCCATAVQDESTHVEVFARYAMYVQGSIAPPSDHFLRLHRSVLDPQLPFLTRFAVHTLLEGWATDEFSIFAKAFKDDLLGEIYGHVCADEIRHVRMGLTCIRELAQESDDKFDAAGAEVIAKSICGLTGEAIDGIARIAGLSDWVVRSWFNDRHHQRMQQLTMNAKEEHESIGIGIHTAVDRDELHRNQ